MPTGFSQLPTPMDIKFVAGDDVAILITIKENGVVMDLTNYTFESKIMTATPTSFTIVNTDLTHGQITLTLTDTVTGAITPTEYDWYLKWTDTSIGYTRTSAEGKCKIS